MPFKPGKSGNPDGRPRKYANEHDKFVAQRNQMLLNNYGITIDDYNRIFESQNGVCAICGKKEQKRQRRGLGTSEVIDSLNVDHDHNTGKVRGLLCYRCNTALGKFYDDPEILLRAYLYLIAGTNQDGES